MTVAKVFVDRKGLLRHQRQHCAARKAVASQRSPVIMVSLRLLMRERIRRALQLKATQALLLEATFISGLQMM